ncbi:hypothetical protein [Pseudomonas oryzihabitans]|uniref:FMN phosphatase YigB (HAD superfamily) n=1 Tax=Pseudomonas oryzihabitans TaxID=47885 RepID=A0AAJ2BHC4_9PSED|nr:hypothetical protein [Pseudomonas psychrotolerans]MDR6234274.1 FMN phosphatase YigB (HAD superfamily) [Pseudomonas psychrotolerans]MDR6356609.1 FMN phosphatase YigB (HAD superfamily) [Pseudomonas psychrotolerans]
MKINSPLNESSKWDFAISDQVDVIFVDFFDTLVERGCHPESIKRYWCSVIIDLFNIGLSASQLYIERIKAEEKLCQQSSKQGFSQEFRYDDMLFLLHNLLTCRGLINRAQDFLSFANVCLEIEESLEIKFQKPVQSAIKKLRAEMKKGKKIYVLSDFYLSKKSLVKFIKHHGFFDIVTDVEVSSETLLTKRGGRAYEYIAKKLDLNRSDVKKIMFGDNLHSDVLAPKEHGFLSYHLPNSCHIEVFNDKKARVLIERIKALISEEAFDFSWVSCAIYLFIRRLYWRLKADNVKDVYFFAREGEFLKKLFDKYQESLFSNLGLSKITSHYVLVSRRSTYLPSLNSLNSYTFNALFSQYSSVSLAAFLKSINLDKYLGFFESKYSEIDFHEVHLNLVLSAGYKCLIEDCEFESIYEQQRLEQREFLNSYLSKIFPEDQNQTITVVDVGWNGSIQDNMARATGRKFKGYYLGVFNTASCYENSVKEGLLFDLQFDRTRGDLIYNEFRAGFEVFMSASHGSIRRYSSNLEDFDVDHNEDELAIYRQHILPFQEKTLSLLDLISQVESECGISDFEISKAVTKCYTIGVLLPSADEVNKFRSIKHYENFGVFDFSHFKSTSVSRMIYLKRLFKNPRRTLTSAWWKPLDFYENNVPIMKYIYFGFKIIFGKVKI